MAGILAYNDSPFRDGFGLVKSLFLKVVSEFKNGSLFYYMYVYPLT